GDNFVTPPEECDPTAPTPPFYCGDEEMCRSCKCVSGVEGVIEGESLVGRSTATGGTILEQDMTSFEGSWSNGAQLWWIDGKPGDSISIPFDVAESGYYDVKVRLTKAVDYGRFELYVGNFPLFVDLYNDGVIPSDEISLGKFNLEARTHYIGAGILGSNPQAVPSYMFGLDYISVKEAFHPLITTIGIYRQGESKFYLRNFNKGGIADTTFPYGEIGDLPIVGDWNGDGLDDVGTVRKQIDIGADGKTKYWLHWYLDYDGNYLFSNQSDIAGLLGNWSDKPIIGDWNGDGKDEIGVMKPVLPAPGAGFYLDYNGNSKWDTASGGDKLVNFGLVTDIPIAGDWNGDGVDTIGFYRPSESKFYLKNSNVEGTADLIFGYGLLGDKPIIGDWNGDGADTIGVYRPSEAKFHLRNSNTAGVADISFGYGLLGDLPITGRWSRCGDNVCDNPLEDLNNCHGDCGCGDGYVTPPEECDPTAPPNNECGVLKDYRYPHKPVLKFKKGTLRLLDKGRTERYGYGTSRGVAACTRTVITEDVKKSLSIYVSEISDWIFNWTKGSFKIVPRYHSVEADFGGFGLSEDPNSPTGYETGHDPPNEQTVLYAKKAGIDISTTDLFLVFTNPYPAPGSLNEGILAQTYIGSVWGDFNGVAPARMTATASATEPLSKEWIVAAGIHELTHEINIGHHIVSGLRDVYEEKYSDKGLPPPSSWCNQTDHVIDETSHPELYFPDSYSAMNPMFTEYPFKVWNSSSTFQSFCYNAESTGSYSWPSVNPLNPNDHYEYFEGYPPTMVYYQFLYQLHYQPEYTSRFFTSTCKNKKLDTSRFGVPNYEFDVDLGGHCLPVYYKCDGLCLDVKFAPEGIVDAASNLPIKAENVNVVYDENEGYVGSFEGQSRIVLSAAEFFADTDEITIETTINLKNITYAPIMFNIDRYYLLLANGDIHFIVQDWYISEPQAWMDLGVSTDIKPGEWHTIKATLKNGTSSIYLDGVKIAQSENKFDGLFIPQSTDSTATPFIGDNLNYQFYFPGRSYFNGKMKSFKFSNKAIY
ncbi:MAG TPA: LamG-like jellyroll fold domain-containing protein, partial [Candidatus Nanoarchaeia archaeon]|nr:LamG-like jellyroll fold domain-containing protein [Candidatus Nanoarchaeia archaeon]